MMAREYTGAKILSDEEQRRRREVPWWSGEAGWTDGPVLVISQVVVATPGQ